MFSYTKNYNLGSECLSRNILVALITMYAIGGLTALKPKLSRIYAFKCKSSDRPKMYSESIARITSTSPLISQTVMMSVAYVFQKEGRIGIVLFTPWIQSIFRGTEMPHYCPERAENEPNSE